MDVGFGEKRRLVGLDGRELAGESVGRVVNDDVVVDGFLQGAPHELGSLGDGGGGVASPTELSDPLLQDDGIDRGQGDFAETRIDEGPKVAAIAGLIAEADNPIGAAA